MSFFADLWDNTVVAGAVVVDAANPANWVTGSAPLTAAAAEYQNAQRDGRDFDADRAVRSGAVGASTVKDAVVATGEDLKKKADGLWWLPWALGAGALVVGAAVAYPYAAPFLAAVKKG